MAKENLISLIEFDKDKGLDLTNLYDHLFCDIEKTKYGVDKKFKKLEDDELENSIKVFLSTVTEYCEKNPNFGDNVIINQKVNPRAEEAFIELIKNLQTELPKYNPYVKYIRLDSLPIQFIHEMINSFNELYIINGVSVLDALHSNINIKTRIMRIFYLELQKLNITDNAINSKEAENLMKKVYEKSKEEFGYEFNYSVILESIKQISEFQGLSIPEINHNGKNLPLQEFANIVLNEQEVHPEMYVNKKSDDLYFVFSKVTEANFHKWYSYARYQENYVKNCPNYNVFRSLKQNGQRPILNNVRGGVTGFLASLNHYQEADVWVAYASREPVTDPNEVDLNKIEMAVTVSAANGKSQFTSHMGIIRSPSDLCAGEEGHKKLSIYLHSFAALMMGKLHLESDRMMNVPLAVMRMILLQEFYSHGYIDEIYMLDDLIQIEDVNTKIFKANLAEEKKNASHIMHHDDFDRNQSCERYYSLCLQKDIFDQKTEYQEKKFKPKIKVIYPNKGKECFKGSRDKDNILELFDKEGKIVEIISPDKQQGKYKWFFSNTVQFRAHSDRYPLISFEINALKEIGKFGKDPEIQYFSTIEKLMLDERMKLDKQEFEKQKSIHADKVMEFSKALKKMSFKDALQKMIEMHKNGSDKGGNGKQEKSSGIGI